MLKPADQDLIAIADSADAFVAEHETGASIFVKELLDEVRTASDAARRVDQAVRTADPLGAHVFLRVVVECAIRLRWVAGDGPEPEIKTLRERIERQRGRDLSRLRSALELLPKSVLFAVGAIK